jgi:hypothetical protein
MMAATIIAIFIIPVTFYVSERFILRHKRTTVPAAALTPIQGGSGNAGPGLGAR